MRGGSRGRAVNTKTPPLPDIQATPDTRQIPIDQVGIKGLRHPVRVLDRQGGEQATVATFNLYVNLPHHFKGTHMSRFVELIESEDREIDTRSFLELLPRLTTRLDAEAGRIEMRFPYFVRKTAPISGVESLLDYEVAFIGETDGKDRRITVQVRIPVTSLSPSSKETASYGAYNQRTLITLTATIADFIWIEELIEVAEQAASSELFGLLKRPDEKHVTERAYENARSVVDITREIAARLGQDRRIADYTIDVESHESVHNYSVCAHLTAPYTP